MAFLSIWNDLVIWKMRIYVYSAINIQPYINSPFSLVSQTLTLTSSILQWHYLGFGYGVLLVGENVSAHILFSCLTVI